MFNEGAVRLDGAFEARVGAAAAILDIARIVIAQRREAIRDWLDLAAQS